MFNLIEKQLPTILKSRAAFDKSRGIDGAYQAVEKTYAGKQAALTAKWHDLLLTIGSTERQRRRHRPRRR